LGLSSWTEYGVLLVGRKRTFTAPIKEGVKISNILEGHSWIGGGGGDW